MSTILLSPEVNTFIYKLEKATIAKIIHQIELLEEFGANLGMPHSKRIEKNLFELRKRIVQKEIKIARKRIIQLVKI